MRSAAVDDSVRKRAFDCRIETIKESEGVERRGVVLDTRSLDTGSFVVDIAQSMPVLPKRQFPFNGNRGL